MGVENFFEGLGKGALSILGTVAPMAATAFGGPLAGVAAQKVIGALGLAPDATTSDIDTALMSATPEQLLALKKMESEFIKDMKALDIDIMKLNVEDRKSAREREISTQDSWTPRVLAATIVGMYCYVQYYLLTGLIDSTMENFVLRSLGTLDAAIGMVLGYYFGSSMSSNQKNEHIAKLVKDRT